MGDLALSIKSYTRLKSLNGADSYVSHNLAACYYQLGEYDKAFDNIIDDETGNLSETESINKNGSKAYSQYLDLGIEDTDTKIIVTTVPDGGVMLDGEKYDLNSRGGGMTFSRNTDRSLIIITITGKDRYATELGSVDSSEILLHEFVGDAIPLGLGGFDGLNAIDIDNRIRAELHFPLRNPAPNHTVRKQKR